MTKSRVAFGVDVTESYIRELGFYTEIEWRRGPRDLF